MRLADTGSERSPLGAHSEEGDHDSGWPGLRGLMRRPHRWRTKVKGQQAGSHSRGTEGAEGADPAGDKKRGQTQMDAEPKQSQ